VLQTVFEPRPLKRECNSYISVRPHIVSGCLSRALQVTRCVIRRSDSGVKLNSNASNSASVEGSHQETSDRDENCNILIFNLQCVCSYVEFLMIIGLESDNWKD
jgi:hypothetical protein